MLTLFGACAVTFMMLMYALERRGRRFVLAFAAGCLLSSSYGFLAGTWPFGIVEVIWAAVAFKRYLDLRQPPMENPEVRAARTASSASTRSAPAATDSPRVESS
jgi:hypothetical protein